MSVVQTLVSLNAVCKENKGTAHYCNTLNQIVCVVRQLVGHGRSCFYFSDGQIRVEFVYIFLTNSNSIIVSEYGPIPNHVAVLSVAFTVKLFVQGMLSSCLCALVHSLTVSTYYGIGTQVPFYA